MTPEFNQQEYNEAHKIISEATSLGEADFINKVKIQNIHICRTALREQPTASITMHHITTL